MSRRGRGQPIDRSDWPPDGPYLAWLKFCEQLRQDNAWPSQRSIATSMGLSPRSPTRVGRLLRGLSPPADEDQAADLLRALGGVGVEVDRGIGLYRKAFAAHTESLATARVPRPEGSLDVRERTGSGSSLAVIHLHSPDAEYGSNSARNEADSKQPTGREHPFAPFLVVDSTYLDRERQKPKEPYVARPPTWADVVHGQNAEVRFLERNQYQALLSKISSSILKPLQKGSDLRLPTVFVTGAPGCGKTTLVRHAAATLVARGDVVVADLGVNQDSLAADYLDSYVQSLAHMAQSGPAVLLLMDDPFFANSGWDLLLQRLALPSYSNIGVLGASPTYLYDNYAPVIGGRQVVFNRFDLNATTLEERRSLAKMYGVKDDAAFIERHEDLLVFAIEVAARESFDEIIARIWSTLNDGKPITPRSGTQDVQWTVAAFLLTCYLHRHYVLCPEPLLRRALQELTGNEKIDYISELGNLTLSEGWHIFQVSRRTTSAKPTSLIGTMHPQVAERAWRLRPLKNVKASEWLVTASVNASECVPQLAEFILACQSPAADSEDRDFAHMVAEAWRDESVSTAQLSALVRSIRSSREAGILFRTSLRERLNRRDQESWLAVIELINLERISEKHGKSELRIKLESVDLPSCLKIANLAAHSSMAIDLLSRGSIKRQALIDVLCDSLDGHLSWRIDGTLLTWLIRNLDEDNLHHLLPQIYEWLDGNPDEQQPRIVLLQWHRGRINSIEDRDLQLLWHKAMEWLNFSSTGTVLLAVLLLADALEKAGRYSGASDEVARETLTWLRGRSEDAEVWRALLVSARGMSASTVADVMREAQAWLRHHPKEVEVEQALLMLMLRRGMPTCDPSDLAKAKDAEVWQALLVSARGMSVSAAADVMREAQAWLRHHPKEVGVERALLMLRLAKAEDAEVWQALLVSARGMSVSAAADVMREAQAWLRHHPKEVGVERALLMLRLIQEMPKSDRGDLAKETLTWLRHYPEDDEVWWALLASTLDTPAALAVDVTRQALTLLREHDSPGTESRKLLLVMILALPRSMAFELARGARAWLSQYSPQDAEEQKLYLLLDRSMLRGGVTPRVTAEVLAWLRGYAEGAALRMALMALAWNMTESVAIAVAREMLAWLRDSPEHPEVWCALVTLTSRLPESVSTDVTEAAQDWLVRHPHDTRVRVALDEKKKRLDESRKRDEILDQKINQALNDPQK